MQGDIIAALPHCCKFIVDQVQGPCRSAAQLTKAAARECCSLTPVSIQVPGTYEIGNRPRCTTLAGARGQMASIYDAYQNVAHVEVVVDEGLLVIAVLLEETAMSAEDIIIIPTI